MFYTVLVYNPFHHWIVLSNLKPCELANMVGQIHWE
jgi:hypothetical protein